MRATRWIALAALLCVAACGRKKEVARIRPAPVPSAPFVPVETCGIRTVSLRPTMGGSMLDFRFKVLDVEKARALFDRKIKPYLFDPSTGTTLGMPDDTKLGALRAGLRNPPVAGKLYYVLFANGYGSVRRGRGVDVVMGDCKVEHLVVQ